MAKRGRPSSFKPEYVEQTKKLALLGATDERLADFFGVAIATIDNWKHAHPEFLVALKECREGADGAVVKSLYQRAMGYSVKTTKIVVVDKVIEKVDIIENYPPDTTACIFWLKNRRPDLWRDRVQTEVTGKVTLEQLVGAAMQQAES